jgi:hypothetical protein
MPLRADGCLAGRSEVARGGTAAGAQAAVHARLQLPAPTRKRSRTTCRWEIISKPIAKQSKNPKAVANWVINNLRAKLERSQREVGLLNNGSAFRAR